MDRTARGKGSKEDTEEAVKHLLRAAALALAGRRTEVPIRAFCHRVTRRGQMLDPVCTTGFHYYPDESQPIPCDETAAETFVIAQAVVERQVVSRELAAERAPEEEERHIWRDIRDVVAAPILDVDDDDICLGTISFDSSRTEQRMHFHEQRAYDIVSDAAKGVAWLWRGTV